MSVCRPLLRNAFTCALLLVAAMGAEAQVLYGAQGGGSATSNLLIINQTTGAVSVVGPLGQALTGLAPQPGTNTMYGVTNGSSACARCLVRVNTTTGAATTIGAGLGLIISEIEFGSNGTLYGWSESSDELASINLATGVATTIPGSGIGTAGDGMALVRGVMYVMPEGDAGTYYRVNTTTGAVTAVGTLTGGTGGNQVTSAATRPTDFVVFGVANTNPGTLFTVNLTNGVITQIGPTIAQLDALAFDTFPAFAAGAIPALSDGLLMALTLLVGIAGIAAIRGRT